MATKRRRAPAHTLRVYDRGGTWWVYVPERGRGRERLSLGLATDSTPQPEAYRIAAARFGAGALAPRAAEGRCEALTDLADLFIAAHVDRWAKRQRENAAYRLTAFLRDLDTQGVRSITAITDDVLTRWVREERGRDGRGGEPITAATINRTIQVARAMARWASSRRPPLCDAGALGAWKNLPEIARNRDPLIPSPAEWAQVVRELEREPSPRDTAEGRARTAANARGAAVLVAVAVQTGLRVDELRHLRAEDIGADVVSVRAWGEWRPKNREERSIPVPPAVADLARELAAWRVRAVGLNGERLALGGHWIEARITPAWERAGLPGEAPGMHDCRRTFATEMSRRPGVSLRDVQRLLGHSDIATTQRYLGRYRSDADRPAVDMGLASVLSTGAAAPVLPLRRRG